MNGDSKILNRLTQLLLAGVFAFASAAASAGWHPGKVGNIGFAYEGSEAVFTLVDVSLGCACPTYWQGYICLDPDRPTYKEEYALLLSAKARKVSLNVNVDETSCKVVAIYEPNQD